MALRVSFVFAALMVACGGTSDGEGAGGRGGFVGEPALCDGTVCACTEAGIRAAIAEGGGPYTFDCDGPTTVVTEAEIRIDNKVILDGEGRLTMDGNLAHRVLSVRTAEAELRGITVRGALISAVPESLTTAGSRSLAARCPGIGRLARSESLTTERS
ncbi:MAG: hypothetical protein WCF10_07840 [Polyangiales bacterium]